MPRRPTSLNLIDQLYRRGLDLIDRDMQAIADSILHTGDKLEPGAARDLRDYIKVLADLRKVAQAQKAEKAAKDKAAKKQISDEELLKAVSGAAPINPLGPKDNK